MTEDCWHCLDALEPEPPHCENCPVECDNLECEAEGCAAELAAYPGVAPSGRLYRARASEEAAAQAWPRDRLPPIAFADGGAGNNPTTLGEVWTGESRTPPELLAEALMTPEQRAEAKSARAKECAELKAWEESEGELGKLRAEVEALRARVEEQAFPERIYVDTGNGAALYRLERWTQEEIDTINAKASELEAVFGEPPPTDPEATGKGGG